jgi:glyoxylase-like metal-dependent hydrolase (beta-lactamase superfamily II)
VNRREPVAGAADFTEGKEFSIGPITVQTLLTSGHSPGGTTYVIRLPDQTVAVVGDSIFAGSMGGSMGAYAEALANNREKILQLPANVVLCPGHGPLTTVGEEATHNPFFAP